MWRTSYSPASILARSRGPVSIEADPAAPDLERPDDLDGVLVELGRDDDLGEESLGARALPNRLYDSMIVRASSTSTVRFSEMIPPKALTTSPSYALR